jgi:hypothetical protein
VTAGRALPVSSAAARTAVERYAARVGLRDTAFDADTTADGAMTVSCHRVVTVPFGALFGYGSGIDRTVTSAARSPAGP